MPPRWRSPLRGPWLTSVLGSVLLLTLPVVTITGLLSFIAYGTQARPDDVGLLHLPYFAVYSRHHLVASAPEEEFAALAKAEAELAGS